MKFLFLFFILISTLSSEAKEMPVKLKWLSAEGLKKIDWKKNKNLSYIYEGWKKYEGPQDVEGKQIAYREINTVSLGNVQFRESLNKYNVDNTYEIILTADIEKNDAVCGEVKKDLNKRFKSTGKTVELNYLAKTKMDFSHYSHLSEWVIGNTRVLFTCGGSTINHEGAMIVLVQIGDKEKINSVKDPVFLKCEGIEQVSWSSGETSTNPVAPFVFIIDENYKKLLRGDRSTLGKTEIFNEQNIVASMENPENKEVETKISIDRISGSFSIDISARKNNVSMKNKTSGSCKKTTSAPAF